MPSSDTQSAVHFYEARASEAASAALVASFGFGADAAAERVAAERRVLFARTCCFVIGETASSSVEVAA